MPIKMKRILQVLNQLLYIGLKYAIVFAQVSIITYSKCAERSTPNVQCAERHLVA
jgi:hypothetical protein